MLPQLFREVALCPKLLLVGDTSEQECPCPQMTLFMLHVLLKVNMPDWRVVDTIKDIGGGVDTSTEFHTSSE